ncbi:MULTISPECIES: Cys-Gln thioester bond-forming surface protein [Nocardiopsis]|uniref:Peptidase n=1 Tax=Nocardiopsis sinuspersici TaxID=501010 RepID=A0A1V3BVM0_9ACTN|nr:MULTISPECIES: Cys-Gln thioester bond-forming surface protein [Nocardiopsis]NYH53618.1 TQXA domain-containing protein [Nocardiopsis sinuspersici]OOC52545.1 peptidase [Nocardiopsis sinuspersici]
MSISSLPRTVGRTGLAASAAAFLAFGLAAAPAAAEPETHDGSARAQYVGNAKSGVNVKMDGQSVGTTLFNLKLEDGTLLTTYCIDLETGIRSSAWYREDDWSTYPGAGDFAAPAKVRWILQNSYPELSAAELAEAAGVDNRHFGDKQALAATQAAIWHFSNGAELTGTDPDGVRDVYDYLVGAAKDVEQPAPSLSITPGEASGKAGETVGEFLIETNGSGIPVNLEAPDGVTLVDIETGEPVDSVDDGDKVGFSVPADAEAGQARFSLEASATVENGRLFRGESDKAATQTLITAEDGEATVSASAGASWTEGEVTPPESPEPSDEPSEPESPAPSEPESPEPTAPEEPSEKPSAPADDQNEPTLPVTGGALAGLVAAGVAALGAGGGAIYLSRKRKAASAEDLEG